MNNPLKINTLRTSCLYLLLGVGCSSIAYGQKSLQTTKAYSFSNLPVVAKTAFKKDTFSITKFGAIPDGNTLNSLSINSTIEQCSKNGGGVVLIPGGIWLTGPIQLRSNVNLFLDHNAVLLFTKDFDQFKLINTEWEGVPAVRNESPISGTDLCNVAITGYGIIDGNGDAWRALKKDKVNQTQWTRLVRSGGILSEDKKIWYPTEKSLAGSKAKEPGVLKEGKTGADFLSVKDFLRPNLLVLTNCKQVLLQGVTFQNSPAWTLHLLLCEDATVSGVEVKNAPYAQNGDGIDIESCKNVIVENSIFDAGDDGICVKSGKDESGRKRNKPTENLIVRNCTVYHAHGGFVIGSEMSGGAKNIFVTDCSFIGSDIGLRFKTKRGRGGVVENIFVRNINMKDIVGQAILFDMYYEAKDPVQLVGEDRQQPKMEELPVTDATPRFRNFYINNVTAVGADAAIFVRGLPEMPIEKIYLDNISISAIKGIEITDAQNIELTNIWIIASDTGKIVKITNSSAISFNNINTVNSTQQAWSVSGEKCKNIAIKNTPSIKTTESIDFSNSAPKASVTVK